ncbi:MAG: hypothetical protein JWN25_3222 [Verrucomicrobiales bacterium]|nr:hypothetical protein [Verrucomicrobiales bacterium]
MDSANLLLRKCSIENFKSLKKVELDHLQPLTVLMGRNNAGKSNILDCFNFLADGSKSMEHALASRGQSLKEILHRKRLDEVILITLEFETPKKRREEWIGQLYAGNKNVTVEQVSNSNFLSRIFLNVTVSENGFSDELSVSNFTAESRNALIFLHKGNSDTIEFVSGNLESLCRSHAGDLPWETKAVEKFNPSPYRLFLGLPEKSTDQKVSLEIAAVVHAHITGIQWIDPHRNLPTQALIEGQHALNADGSNLPDVLHWLYNNKPGQFRRVENELRKLVPNLGRLYTPTSQNMTTLGAIDPEEEDLFYTMNQMSFGTKSAIAIITKVALAQPGAWISIEEPETYLHPAAQVSLFHFLRDESKDKTIFVATHSTPIAASTPIDSLYIVQRAADYSTQADPVTPKDVFDVIEQLAVKPSFSFESDAIVFVEDADAVAIYEALAKKYNFHVRIQFLDAEQGNTLHFHANAQVALSRYVHTLVYAIFDSDTELDVEQEKIRNRTVEQLKLPPGQVVTLDASEVEVYLLDAKAILRAFSGIRLTEAALTDKIAKARGMGPAKKVLSDLFLELRLGKYDGAAGARIAESMDRIPLIIESFFQKMDIDSRPFWKI